MVPIGHLFDTWMGEEFLPNKLLAFVLAPWLQPLTNGGPRGTPKREWMTTKKITDEGFQRIALLPRKRRPWKTFDLTCRAVEGVYFIEKSHSNYFRFSSRGVNAPPLAPTHARARKCSYKFISPLKCFVVRLFSCVDVKYCIFWSNYFYRSRKKKSKNK